MIEPSLTTVSQPLRELGTRAVQRLLDRIGGATLPPAPKLPPLAPAEVLPTHLVVRGQLRLPAPRAGRLRPTVQPATDRLARPSVRPAARQPRQGSVRTTRQRGFRPGHSTRRPGIGVLRRIGSGTGPMRVPGRRFHHAQTSVPSCSNTAGGAAGRRLTAACSRGVAGAGMPLGVMAGDHAATPRRPPRPPCRPAIRLDHHLQRQFLRLGRLGRGLRAGPTTPARSTTAPAARPTGAPARSSPTPARPRTSPRTATAT